MNYIDTHCHILLKQFDDDRNEVLKKIDEELDFYIEIGIDIETSKKIVDFVKEHSKAYGTVGIHPTESENIKKETLEELEKLSLSSKIVAIGEIGLDFYWDTSKQDQYKVFDAQMEIARKIDKPLVLHIRQAYNQTYEFLKKIPLPKKVGVVHCFSDTWETAKKFLDMGFYLGFDGPITYPNNKELREVVEKTPLDKILPETDSPFLPPVPYRGQRNNPIYVKFVYEKIAEIKNKSVEEMKEILGNNAKKLFFE